MNIKIKKANYLILTFLIAGILLLTNTDRAYGNTILSNPIFPKSCTTDLKNVYYVSPYNNHLYMMEKGKNKRTRLTINEVSEDGIITNGGYIYYENKLENNKLHRISMDGKSDTAVNNDENFLKNINRYCAVYNGYVYSYGQDEADGIWRIDPNTLKKTRIISDAVYPLVKVYKDYIYYVNYNDYKPYRVSINGKSKIRLSDTPVVNRYAEFDIGNFQIYGGKMYCINYTSDGKSNLVIMNLDGKNKKLISRNVSDFKVYKDYLYYIGGPDNKNMYKLKLDGTSSKCLLSANFSRFELIENNTIIYRVKHNDVMEPLDGRLFMIDLNGKGNVELK